MSDHDTPHRTPPDPEEIRRYLLGRLSRDESDTLEAQLLHDGRLFELAEATEDELVDRYVRGELPSDDAKRFERHLLPSRRIRERVDLARALAAWVDRERGGQLTTARPEPGGVVVPISHRLHRFRRTARLAWAAALVAAIAAGVLAFQVVSLQERLDDARTATGVEQARWVEEAPVPIAATEEPAAEPVAPVTGPEVTSEQVEGLERELAAARERIATLERETAEVDGARTSANEAPGVGATARLVLAAITRGVAGEKSLSLENAQRAEIFIPLGPREPSGAIRATVTRNGTVIWDEPDAEVMTEEGHSMARLVLSRKSLSEGRYLLRVTESGREERAVSYPFSVEQ